MASGFARKACTEKVFFGWELREARTARGAITSNSL
jgi:hypothetical protein